MKDIVTPVPPEEVRSMIKKSLETAALVNYTKLSGEAKIEGESLSYKGTNSIDGLFFSSTQRTCAVIMTSHQPKSSKILST